jgi:hypothetical protein
VFFLAVAQWLRAGMMPNEALAIAGGLAGEPSTVAGWHKLAE